MQLYVGNLTYHVDEMDLRKFFRDYGHLRSVEMLRQSGRQYAFVEFDNDNDAKAALHDMNGCELEGTPVRLSEVISTRPTMQETNYPRNISEVVARQPQRLSDNNQRYYPRDVSESDNRPSRFVSYKVATRKTPFCVRIENLPLRFEWRELKYMMQQCGTVTRTDAHAPIPHIGHVYFECHADVKRAMDKFQGEEIMGQVIRLVDETYITRENIELDLATPAMQVTQKRTRPLTPPPTPSGYLMNTDGLDPTREAGGKRFRLDNGMAQVHEHHRQHDRLERSPSGSGSGITQLFSSSERRRLIAQGAISEIREEGMGRQEQEMVRFNSSCADSMHSTPSQVPKEIELRRLGKLIESIVKYHSPRFLLLNDLVKTLWVSLEPRFANIQQFSGSDYQGFIRDYCNGVELVSHCSYPYLWWDGPK